MGRDREYEILLNKYNMLVAKHRDLEEQSQTKDRLHRDYEAKCEVLDGHARKLCEMILAKDKSEMVLGDEKTWHSYSTDELIAKAQVVFVRYNQERTKLLNDVMAVAENRGQELESLKDQISQMLYSGNMAATTPEDLLANAERARKEKEALEKAPNSTKQALADGRINVIIEEDEDCDEGEIEAIRKMMDVAEQAKLTASSTPISRSAEKIERMKQADRDVAKAHVVDLQEYIDKCKEVEWAVMEMIGTYGISKYTEIYKRCLECYPSLTEKKVRSAVGSLSGMGAVRSAKLELPTSRCNVYELTALGERIYLAHFDKKPVMSEMTKVCKLHDNPNHGYGIMELEQILVDSGRYVSVESSNRSQPIEIEIDGHKVQYIPDIICRSNKFTDYYEYELGTHPQHEFNLKCNKMLKVTRFLHFVSPSKDVIAVIKRQVDTWIETRGSGSIRNAVIKLGTSLSLRNDGDWVVVYELSKSTTPIKDLLN